MSVSAPCAPVAPSTNTGYTVSSVELFAVAVNVVELTAELTSIAPIYASKAVPLTVIASASRVPSISALPEISKVAASN